MGKWLAIAGRYIGKRYAVVVLSGWLVLFMEALSRNQAWGAMEWSLLHLPALLLNGSFLLGARLVLTAATGKLRLSYWIVSGIGFTLALITGVKSKMLGLPLLPWDFVLTGEAGDMVEYVKNIVTVQLVVDLIVFLAVSWLLLYKYSAGVKTVRWKERVGLTVFAIALIGVLYTDKPIPIKAAFGISPINYDQSANVDTNGWLLATVMNLEYMGVAKLDDYNEKAIADIVASSAGPIGRDSENTADGVKPNVIVVLSESLWDPTQMKGVAFNRDPMPFFRELQQTAATGTLLTPQYGGGTANVEFEVLTGNSMRFLPQGTIPYNQHITRGVDSLAGIMARQGYYSTAISPFHRWYFNSDKVYKNFGFAQYIPLEFFDPVYEGTYIADSEVASMIIEQTGKTSERDFIFANTMENHFHYNPGKFKNNTFEVEGDIPHDTKRMLETYAYGVQDADNMLRTLVEHYRESGEPTVIAFFGDHLPYLGDDYKAYKDAKWITGESDPDFPDKMHRTPVAVWTNFLPEQQETLSMSPSFLGSYVLDKANIPGTYFTDFLRELAVQAPIVPPQKFDSYLNVKESGLRRYELLQYDSLFGERHAYGDLKDRIINPDYFLGIGPIEISDVKVDTGKAGADTGIAVTGNHIPALGKLYANGKALATRRENDGALSAHVPSEAFESGSCDIQVKLFDSKGIIVGQSNIRNVQIVPK